MDAYRTQLFEYLKNRMNAIAPNLTVLVGELVGARLIAHAGRRHNTISIEPLIITITNRLIVTYVFCGG
jgi:hypothetical protein